MNKFKGILFTTDLDGTLLKKDKSISLKNKEAIENFGYTVSSFKSYLKQNNVLIFALDKQNKTQLAVKCFETDFSKEILELSALDDDAVNKVAKKLVTADGSVYKLDTVNGMKMIEARLSQKSEKESYFSVQYITIRNGKIYSFSLSFEGEESEESINTAWNLVKGFFIKDVTTVSSWSAANIFEFSVIWIIIGVAVLAIVLIIISFIKDRRKKSAEAEKGNDVINRRS